MPALKPATIGQKLLTDFGQNRPLTTVFTNDINPRAFIKKGHEKYKATIVEEGATIGANATIVCGNRIGKYALVAAGAVVTSDVPDFAMVVGVPAMVIGTVDKSGNRVNKE